jgi:hypothetical protein
MSPERSLAASLLCVAAACSSHDVDTVTVTATTMDQLAAAVREYAVALGDAPAGDSRAIFRALHGESPRGQAFLRARIGEPSDELRDPWGRSYELDVRAGVIHVRCAGPNGRLGDDDDRVLDAPLEPRRSPP